ncbi:MAG: hypothetical protein ACYSU8_07690, partial [Planctomycetota bacterium]
MKSRNILIMVVFGLVVCLTSLVRAAPVSTAFTYHGRLEENNHPATGDYDFEFALFDDPNIFAGNQVGDTLFFDDQQVKGGNFRVDLDFGNDPNVFNGEARWLEMAVRDGDVNDPNAFVTLLPGIELTAAPYAFSANRLGGKELADLLQKNEPNAVSESMIKHGSVTKEKIGNGAVSREKLENGAINSAKLENGAVGKEKIGNGAISKEKIENNAVDPNKLATNAVAREKIQNGAINSAKLENGAVGKDKLGDISGYYLNTNYTGTVIHIINVGNDAIAGESGTGIGVKGTSQGEFTENGFGVRGENNSGDGTGVYGDALGGRGLWGKSEGTTGIGYGVYGENTADGTGVYGISEGGVGVLGESVTGYAGLFEGPTVVDGSLYVGDPSAGTALEALHVVGKVYVDEMDAAVGGGSTVKWESGRLVEQSSSERYKDNIQPLTDNPEKILQAESKSFT